jgi:cyclophilin family peptidyl-prolyl cis-trans isomerase
MLVPALAAAEDKKPVVVMETSLGTIKIELYPNKARETVENFLSYVNANDKIYDGTIFHNVTENMIQGGLFDANMKPKPTKPPIDCEGFNGIKNERGTIAMVQRREVDDNTNITTPFVINVKDNKNLDDKDNKFSSCVFGKVIEGMDVVDKIAASKTAKKGRFENVPVKEVTIKSIKVEK